jgi:hypothetical protein
MSATQPQPTLSPRNLPVVHCDISEMKDVLKSGSIAKFTLPSHDIFKWSLQDWSNANGSSKASFQMTDDIVNKMYRYIDNLKEGELFDPIEMTIKEDLDLKADFTTVDKIIKNMREFIEVPLELPYESEITSMKLAKIWAKKWRAYGVVNSRLLPNFKFEYPEVFRSWVGMFNFVWFGLSPGGMHFDIWDNTLVQLCGRKSVLIYSPDLTNPIDGNQRPKSFNVVNSLSLTTLKRHKYLRYLPYTIVDLEPGEGVIIPARAYHSPVARTHDSVTLNSFLIPHYRTGPHPYAKECRPNILLEPGFRTLRFAYSAFRLKLLKYGPYDLI